MNNKENKYPIIDVNLQQIKRSIQNLEYLVNISPDLLLNFDFGIMKSEVSNFENLLNNHFKK